MPKEQKKQTSSDTPTPRRGKATASHSVDRETLLKGLECVAPALASSGSVPEFKHLWFDGKAVHAYDGGLGLQAPLPTEFTCGVLGATLLGLLNNTSAKEVELNSLEDGLEFKAGRSRIVIPIMESSRDPWRFNLGKSTVSIDLTEGCLEGLKRAQAIKPKDPTRVEHYGVVLFPGRDDLELYSTDGTSAAQIIVKQQVAKELLKVVLPHPFVNQVVKHAKADTKIVVLPDCLAVKANGMLICSNLLDSSDVPDMPKMVSRLVSGEERLSKIPEDFAEALKRASVLVGKATPYVTLAVEGKELRLQGKFAFGSINESMALSVAGDDGELELNLTRLAAISGLALEFALTGQAIILMGEDDALFLLAAHDDKDEH